MDIAFYTGPKGKIIGISPASPEELQVYSTPFMDIPEGCQLAARVRKHPTAKGRMEILIGAAETGKPLALEGEDKGEDKPLPPAPVPRALEVRPGLKSANDADLELMAVHNGIRVTEQWKRRARPMREADVEKAMRERKKLEDAGKLTPAPAINAMTRPKVTAS